MYTGVTGELVVPILKPASLNPLCKAFVISHNLFFNSGLFRINSIRFKAPTTRGIGKAFAKICEKNNTQLIHISTDYVFDGTANQPYKETDQTNPVSIYGKSKLQGEELAIQNCPSTIIIRTAWLYSSFKNNFVKTMLRLMKEKENINVVNDQFGCPTYAADLGAAIMQIIISNQSKENPGIYHYSNAGIINWYQFAVAIQDFSNSNCVVNPIPTSQYPTAAKRPAYSVLDTTKIKETFGVAILEWEESLGKCLEKFK